MRVKIIEILTNQFTVIILEPPQSKGVVTVFLSRAMQCIQVGFEDQIFISIPNVGKIREFIDEFFVTHHIEIIESFSRANYYLDECHPTTDFLRLNFSDIKAPPIKGHWIDPFYSYEEGAEIKEYRCKCEVIIEVGETREFLTIEELRKSGHSCGHKDLFAFLSKIKLI